MLTPAAGREAVEQAVRRVTRTRGEPLDSGVRRSMEARLDADFSTVRVHRDAEAASSAQQVGSRAYTVGQHLVFGAGHYRPGTVSGDRLLAHELTHAAQQRGRTDFSDLRPAGGRGPAEREAAHAADGARPAMTTAVRAGLALEEGTSEIVDTVKSFQTRGSGPTTTFSATMLREQFRTHAEAEAARKGTVPKPSVMDWHDVRIELDPSVPEIRLPLTISAHAATAADYGSDKPTRINNGGVSAARVAEVADKYVASITQRLNGWYTLTVPTCAGVPWSGRTLPIRVAVTKVTSGPADVNVAVSPHEGRSFVAGNLVLLYAGDLSEGTLAHEGVHMVLGHPDEYEEKDAALIQKAPLQKGKERIRRDFTLAGDYGLWGLRWAQLHARHFSFVPVFVQEVLRRAGHADCQPTLQEVNRPDPTMFRLQLDLGGASYGGAGAMAVGLGVDAGWSMNRERTWRAFLGAHGRFLLASDATTNNAFLVGARLGFERRWNPSGLGPGLQLFGESGLTGEKKTSWAAPAARTETLYGGVGLRGDIGWYPGGGGAMRLGLEAMTGMRLDSERLRIVQLGFTAAFDF